MNHLQLAWKDAPGRSAEIRYLDILIDGRQLCDLARSAQTPGPSGTDSDTYLGLFDWEEYNLACLQDWGCEQLTLLGCSCGTAECRPLRARFTQRGPQITWSHFHNSYRPDWNYAALGPFTFEAAQYRAEVDRALRQWGQGWSV